MQLPYQRLKICGDLLFIAQGGTINVFTSSENSWSHVDSWSHPDLEREENQPTPSAGPPRAPSGAGTVQDGAEKDRPSKRVKLDDGLTTTDAAKTTQAAENAGAAEKRKASKIVSSKPTDYPFFTILETTSTGHHLIAVSGHDKTIWVFDIDNSGRFFRELEPSRRVMPKRPCSLVITPDDKTIISGDKFGDVYALPVLDDEDEVAALQVSAVARLTPAAPRHRPQADETTVHSARNLRALANQKLHLERQQLKNGSGPSSVSGGDGSSATSPAEDADSAAAAAAFEHGCLLLGHVSMLTSVALGFSRSPDGTQRSYILTADRDEHIRVSRGMPQAHVIETFCLGHEQFVSELCIVREAVGPSGLGCLLVSGGGDPDLFVWDWLRGRLLSRTNLLTRVREVDRAAKIVAVSAIRPVALSEKQAAIHGFKFVVAVICERVRAIFFFRLTEDGVLRHHQTYREIATWPIDIASVPPTSQARTTLFMATFDLSSAPPHQRGSVRQAMGYYLNEHDSKFCPSRGIGGHKGDTSVPKFMRKDTDISQEEVWRALYTIESLRKNSSEGTGGNANAAEAVED